MYIEISQPKNDYMVSKGSNMYLLLRLFLGCNHAFLHERLKKKFDIEHDLIPHFCNFVLIKNNDA